MRVMLAKALKLLSVFAQNALEHVRSDDARVHVPHFIQSFGVSHDQASLRAERVLDLVVIDEFKAFLHEELGQLVCVAETLQTRVHVASIA